MLELPSEDERRTSFLETINEAVIQLSFPHLSPRLRRMYKAWLVLSRRQLCLITVHRLNINLCLYLCLFINDVDTLSPESLGYGMRLIMFPLQRTAYTLQRRLEIHTFHAYYGLTPGLVGSPTK